MSPTPGRIVLYRAQTGSYTWPAIITATTDSLTPDGASVLSSPEHVHLTVFTAGMGSIGDGQYPRSECGYQEWDVPHSTFPQTASPDNDSFPPGHWAWPAPS